MKHYSKGLHIFESDKITTSYKNFSNRSSENITHRLLSRHVTLTVLNFETVMLGKQSLDEFLSNINKGKTLIVSVAPQSRASISIHYGLSPLQVLRKLTTLFKPLSVASDN
ncbi:hypothetical protein L1887_27960 [Cichorium endivia]|nr:hypothetical protein L1887_27960 [Cichorium endivia]